MSESSSLPRRCFASDNYAGICPEALESLLESNAGHVSSYGEDPWCAQASDLLRELFETDCEVFFTFNGTAANSLVLAHLCHSYHSVICHELAHIECDECGGPEFFSHGSKLLQAGGANGKVDLDHVEKIVTKRSDIHYPKAKVLSLTQATEVGTVYTVEELCAVQEVALRHRLKVHMDGARFANAMATLNVAPKEVTWKAGVDVLCFGSTKNGAPVGEAVVFFDKTLAEEFDYRCKQAGQLASKMRFIAAPFVGLLKDGAWLQHAAHANAMAERLEKGLRGLEGVEILFPRQANGVFIQLPEGVAERLWAKGWKFYDMIGAGYRLMCAWDIQEADVDSFLVELKAELSG